MLASKGAARSHRRFASKHQAAQSPPPPLTSTQSGRPSIAEQCAARGFRLTEKRRLVVAAFDRMDGPFALEDAYLHCRDLGLDVNRSSIFRLISNLADAGILTLVGADHRRALYGAPLPVELVIEAAGRAQARVDDPVLVEMLVAAAARMGLDVTRGQIRVSIVDGAPSQA